MKIAFAMVLLLAGGFTGLASGADLGNGPLPRLCVCGESCQCAAGECPAKCPTVQYAAQIPANPYPGGPTPGNWYGTPAVRGVQSCPGGVCPVPSSQYFSAPIQVGQSCPGGVCSVASAPTAGCASCGSAAAAVTGTASAPRSHPILHRIFHPFQRSARAGRGCCGG